MHLAHRRLSIIDLSRAADQPFGATVSSLTYNGELYNARELRRRAGRAGVRVPRRPTPRCVLEAWRRWGTDCLPRLRGMFAFAVFDERTGELMLARDQLGIKPLFLAAARRRGGVRVRAEGAGHGGRPGAAGRRGALVASLLYYWVPDQRCATGEAEKLPPGSWLRVPARRPGRRAARTGAARRGGRGRSGPRRADLRPSSRSRSRRPPDVRRARGDVPVRRARLQLPDRARPADDPGISAYTIGFRAEDAKFEAMPDDLRYARKVAEKFGVDLHEIEIAPHVLDLLPRMTDHLDEPIGDPAAINTFLICDGRPRGRRQGDAVRDGRRRAVRRLPQAPGQPARARYQRVPAHCATRPVQPVVDRLPVRVRGRGLPVGAVREAVPVVRRLPEETAFRRSYTMYDRPKLLALLDPDLAPDGRRRADRARGHLPRQRR